MVQRANYMRIAIAGIATETNTFNPFHIGTKEFFQASGSEIKPVWSRVYTNSTIMGIIDYCEKNNIEIVPLFCARTLPAGTVRKPDYEAMREKIISMLQQMSVDAVCLGMHGSMCVETIDDPEGDMMAHIHALVPLLPIHLALDMHATITDTMTLHAASISTYKTAPHTDMHNIGVLCASIAHKSFMEKRKTLAVVVRIPLILSGEISMTTESPMSILIESLYKAERLEHVLSASYGLAFPWADSPYMGTTAIVSTFEDDMTLAHKTCYELAKNLWACRENFHYTMETMLPVDALTIMKNNLSKRPVILSDVGDNATAGASEDVVNFLADILDSDVKTCFFAMIYDPDAYHTIVKNKPGDTITVSIGRFFCEERKLSITGTVLSFFSYLNRNAVIVKVGNTDIVIGQQRMPVAETNIFEAAAITPADYKCIVIKCGYHGDDLHAIASRNILVLTKGDTDPILERITYTRIPRPMYPLDKKMVW